LFTHLHTHTEYSMLDGISRIPDLVNQTKELGMEALAITDHGSLYGAVDFYSECKEQGIKPIIGCEVYVAHQSRFDRGAGERSPFHLVLLARNNTGYRNLMQLVTKAHLEGFHYRPRIDKELLEQYREGLVCFSGCPSAEVPRLITEGNAAEANRVALWYKELFGDGYFLELQRHKDVPMLPDINQGLVVMSKELEIPLVVTNDAHYVRQPDAAFQDVYICIQTNTTVHDEKRLRMEDNSYYIKSPQEMQELFPDFPEALQSTQLIADMCNVELGFGQTHLPKYPTPNGADAEEYLANLCWQGFKQRYPRPTPEAEQRLRYELEVIKHTQFANYFLVVWDIIDFVRRNQILFGVRGSAAASVALYCLGITDIDPMEYRLVFERFLNFERKEMPDIDMDFQDDRRDEVLHYVIDRYGSDRVAQIITFGTLGAKAALRDVGRGLGMSYGDVDRIARMVPFKARTLEDAMKANPEMQSTYDSDEAVRKLVDNARGLEGIVHHVSTHAAGVLIADDPLTETVPLQRPTRGDENSPVLMTQYSMDPVAKLGLLKMDFLGLTNLTILDRAVKLLDETRGIKIDISRLPLDDQETFALLSSGKTTEVFQLESAGMQRYIKELKPTCLGDIAAMIALYRPGPMEHIDTFINAKHGRAPISYPHPSLQDLLDETYGVIVYQDQVLLILQNFAGYSLGEADTVRKAMGKKIASLMAKERERFIEGAQQKGFTPDMGQAIFNLIEPFAGYAFNKAHSVSYGLISYWTAYFKAHYPVEYMASVMNSRLDHTDKVVNAINECSKLNIPVLLPDVNLSGEFFTIDKVNGPRPSLRFGLAAVKNVGEGAVRPMVEERKKNGPYLSIDDFCRRADVSSLNRRTLESLVKAGAFDSLGPRGAVLAAIDQIIATAQLETRMRNSGQTSMFGALDPAADGQGAPGIPLNGLDAGVEEKAAWERELLGVSLSYNPLFTLASIDAGDAICSLDELDEELQGQSLTLVGHVSSLTERYTREQKKFVIVSLDLLGGPVETLVWPDVLERTQPVWQEGRLVKVTGKLRVRGDQFSLACDQVEEFVAKAPPAEDKPAPAPARRSERTPQPISTPAAVSIPAEPPASNGARPSSAAAVAARVGSSRAVVLTIRESEDAMEDAHLLREVVQVLLEYPGKDRVNLQIRTGGKRVLMELPVVSTGYCQEMKDRLERVLGEETVMLQGGNGDEEAPPF
jgi:DNA polymerase III subunit alpha